MMRSQFTWSSGKVLLMLGAAGKIDIAATRNGTRVWA